MDEGEKYFQGTSKTHQALRKIAGKLNGLGIDYVVVGGMAMFQHGYRRFTEDVNLLVTLAGLKEIHRALAGLGYRPLFYGSKHLRDVEYGVRIEFLVTGEFPGNGKPKPVALPTPAMVAEEENGIRYINLPALVELKLVSGISNAQRAKDFADVIEMINVLGLPRDFVEKLHPFVQEKFKQLWDDANPPTKRYVTRWRKHGETGSPDQIIAILKASDDTFRAMLADGVTPDLKRCKLNEYVYLTTNDPAIARKCDMHDETEFMNVDDAAES